MISINFKAVVDIASILLVLGLSLVIGTVFTVLDSFLDIFLGFAMAVAGSSGSEHRSSKSAVLCQLVISLTACGAAVYLGLHGCQLVSYFFAIAGGVALPLSIGKLFKIE